MRKLLELFIPIAAGALGVRENTTIRKHTVIRPALWHPEITTTHSGKETQYNHAPDVPRTILGNHCPPGQDHEELRRLLNS